MDDDLLQEITGGCNSVDISNTNCQCDDSSDSYESYESVNDNRFNHSIDYDSSEELDFLSDLSGTPLHETVIFDSSDNTQQFVVPFDVNSLGCKIILLGNKIFITIEDPNNIPDILAVLQCIYEEDPTKSFQIEYSFCAMCGISKDRHHNQRHGFQQAYENYRCRNCNGFFFEHDHIKKPCFHPHKYIGN